MYPDVPYDGYTWPITQHAGVISSNVISRLLEACSQYIGREVDTTAINNYLIQNGVLTANIRSDSNQPDAWRDYQQILSELGLIYSTDIAGCIILTPVATAFLDGSINYEELLTLQLLKYQYPNGHKTQISPSLRESLPPSLRNLPSVTMIQSFAGVQIRPAVVIWLILYELLQRGTIPAISIEEMQRYVIRCTTHYDVSFCVSAILASRTTTYELPRMVRARRNIQDWSKLLSSTPLFSFSNSTLSLSEYSIIHSDEILSICQSLSQPASFWMPAETNYKWDWFGFYGNIDIGINLIPQSSIADNSTITDDDVSNNVIRGVNLQPFSEITHSELPKTQRQVVSVYDFRKSEKGRNLHDSMINMIAQKCISRGARVYSDPKTVDLFVHYRDQEYLIEVKSITPSNFIARMRYAIGQVCQYDYLLPRQLEHRRLALAFTANIPDESWSIPFVTQYLSMDLLTLHSSMLHVKSISPTTLELFG